MFNIRNVDMFLSVARYARFPVSPSNHYAFYKYNVSFLALVCLSECVSVCVCLCTLASLTLVSWATVCTLVPIRKQHHRHQHHPRTHQLSGRSSLDQLNSSMRPSECVHCSLCCRCVCCDWIFKPNECALFIPPNIEQLIDMHALAPILLLADFMSVWSEFCCLC